MGRGPGLSLAVIAAASILAGCAGSRDQDMRLARPALASPDRETDLDREWRRYEGVHFEELPPPGPPAPRFTFGFGSGQPQRLYFD